MDGEQELSIYREEELGRRRAHADGVPNANDPTTYLYLYLYPK